MSEEARAAMGELRGESGFLSGVRSDLGRDWLGLRRKRWRLERSEQACWIVRCLT
jgi:hypothetical protein